MIAHLDGINAQVPNDKRVKSILSTPPRGMRGGINAGVAISQGEYVMKLDAHCLMDEGFDLKLISEYENGTLSPHTISVPRRKRLDADNWCIQDVGKIDVDYEYVCYPDNPADFGGAGLHGRQWNDRSRERVDDPKYAIDDLMSFQGSSWFTTREYFDFLELMDDGNFGTFAHEAQEIGFKAWLSGGRVVVNKKTWYAHLHKGKKHGRGYVLANSDRNKGTAFTNRWMKERVWHKQTLPFSWMLEHFWPVPTWNDERLAEVKSYERLS